jgi:hypothetical protein
VGVLDGDPRESGGERRYCNVAFSGWNAVNQVEYAINANLDLASIGPVLDKLGDSITELEVVGDVHRETTESTGLDREDSSTFAISLNEKPGSERSEKSAEKVS